MGIREERKGLPRLCLFVSVAHVSETLMVAELGAMSQATNQRLNSILPGTKPQAMAKLRYVDWTPKP